MQNSELIEGSKMEATALYGFNRKEDDELSFKKNDVLKILKITSDNWLKAEKDGVSGLIPANYVEVKSHPWYKGKITRKEAECKLMESGMNDGAFLVRESESDPDKFSLSVRFANSVQHFKILQDHYNKYFLWVMKFNTINDLVEYHKGNSVTKNGPEILLKENEPKKKVKANYDFVAQESEELSFKRGDIIDILEEVEVNWWKGLHSTTKKEGLIPSTYVTCLDQ